MKMNAAIVALGALAQSSRLSVYRLLVQAGKQGLAAGDIAERLGIPTATLSFHLRTLSHAGLVHDRRDGRFIFYSANYGLMNDLVGFLTENCCGGASCAPASVMTARRRAS
jgi:DNA-binding transcriptional ArsR family regulator